MPSLPSPAPSSGDRGSGGCPEGAYKPSHRKLQRAVRDVRQHHSAPSPSRGPREITESGQVHEAGAPRTADGAQRDKAKPGPLDGTLPARQDGTVRGQLTRAEPELGSCQPDFRPGAPGRAEHRLPRRRPHSAWHIPVQSAEPLIRSLAQPERGGQPSSGSREHGWQWGQSTQGAR